MAKSDRWLKPKNLEKLTEWASDKENTIARIATKMGISASTFYNWLNEYDEFREAFDNGRRCVDEEVESAFFRMCTGFKETVREEKTVVNNKGEETVTVEKEIFVPPSVPALKLYLVNRMPNKYRPENAVEMSGSGEDGGTGVVMLPEIEEPEEVFEAEIVKSDEKDSSLRSE